LIKTKIGDKVKFKIIDRGNNDVIGKEIGTIKEKIINCYLGYQELLYKIETDKEKVYLVYNNEIETKL